MTTKRPGASQLRMLSPGETARAPGFVSLASARSQYAARTTTAPAVYNDGQLQAPRERARAHRTVSFRHWARQTFGKRSPELMSPKLRRIMQSEG